MIRLAKKITHKCIRLLLFPFRSQYIKRNGAIINSSGIEIPNNVLLGAVRDAIREGHTATIVVKGWSMRPFLEHLRDKVILDAPGEVKEGEAVLAEISPDTFVLHRIIEIKSHGKDKELDEITLMGDGNIRGTEQCLRKDICGRVTYYIRPNRTIPASDPTLRKNIQRWKKLLPIRRYLLVIYKALI